MNKDIQNILNKVNQEAFFSNLEMENICSLNRPMMLDYKRVHYSLINVIYTTSMIDMISNMYIRVSICSITAYLSMSS